MKTEPKPKADDSKSAKYTDADVKKLVDAASNALYGLGGSGNQAHDNLVAALRPFRAK